MSTALPWHEEHWARLAAARHQQRVPHALLLRGPQGLGKRRFAERLARALVCPQPTPEGNACETCVACRQTSAGSHPDIVHLAPDEPGRQIKIGAVRQLTAKSVLSAQPKAYRVCLIQPADAMNQAAANALLKTLEEPTERTVLLLVTSRPDRLPATIRSRCQALAFRVPPTEIARAWLTEQGPVAGLEDCLPLAAGAPLTALEAAAQDWVGDARRLTGDLAALAARDINPLQVVENWAERPLTTVIAGLKRLSSDLVKSTSGLGDGPLYHPVLRSELQSLAKKIDLRGVYSFCDRLIDCERAAANNANTQMALEHLVNGWLELTRPGGR